MSESILLALFLNLWYFIWLWNCCDQMCLQHLIVWGLELVSTRLSGNAALLHTEAFSPHLGLKWPFQQVFSFQPNLDIVQTSESFSPVFFFFGGIYRNYSWTIILSCLNFDFLCIDEKVLIPSGGLVSLKRSVSGWMDCSAQQHCTSIDPSFLAGMCLIHRVRDFNSVVYVRLIRSYWGNN